MHLSTRGPLREALYGALHIVVACIHALRDEESVDVGVRLGELVRALRQGALVAGIPLDSALGAAEMKAARQVWQLKRRAESVRLGTPLDALGGARAGVTRHEAVIAITAAGWLRAACLPCLATVLEPAAFAGSCIGERGRVERRAYLREGGMRGRDRARVERCTTRDATGCETGVERALRIDGAPLEPRAPVIA